MLNKLSHTAAYIAVKFYGLSMSPKLSGHFDPFILNFYERMVRFLPKHLSWYYKALKSPFWRQLFVASEELLLPGDLMHIVCRKYYITKMAQESFERGYNQLVVLGAGLDHLGAFAAANNISSFEIDTPFMAQQKRAFISENGYESDRLNILEIDVTKQNVAEVLYDHPLFDTRQKTIFIAEGFFDYLSLSDAKAVLDDLKRVAPEHRLISTLFSLDELNIFHRLSFTSGVAMVGEAIKLPLNRREFNSMLSEAGYTSEKELGYQEMEKDLIKPSGIDLPVMKGFYVMHSLLKS